MSLRQRNFSGKIVQRSGVKPLLYSHIGLVSVLASVGERSVVEMDRAVAVNRMLLKGNAWDRFGTKVFAAIQVLSGAESANLEN